MSVGALRGTHIVSVREEKRSTSTAASLAQNEVKPAVEANNETQHREPKHHPRHAQVAQCKRLIEDTLSAWSGLPAFENALMRELIACTSGVIPASSISLKNLSATRTRRQAPALPKTKPGGGGRAKQGEKKRNVLITPFSQRVCCAFFLRYPYAAAVFVYGVPRIVARGLPAVSSFQQPCDGCFVHCSELVQKVYHTFHDYPRREGKNKQPQRSKDACQPPENPPNAAPLVGAQATPACGTDGAWGRPHSASHREMSVENVTIVGRSSHATIAS